MTPVLGWQRDPVLMAGSSPPRSCTACGSARCAAASRPARASRPASFFYAALAVFYLAEGSPLHDLAERYLFSAHMV